MTLDALTKTKQDLVSELEALAELAQGSGAPSLRERILNDRLPRLREERLVLVVLGEFNHGKSTFVNALLGGSILPSGITPTTALIHEVRHGESPRAEVVFRAKSSGTDVIDPLRVAGGERKEVPWAKIADLVVGGDLIPDDVLRVELEYPAKVLENKVTLVDTPGVNDLNLQRAEITYGYVPRADAVVFLLDAGQILKESERRFLRDKLLGAGRDRIVFAINKADTLDDSEREQVLTYAKKQLAQIVPGAPTLLISAERQLNGDEAGSGFVELRKKLDELLGDNRLRMLVDYGADEGLRVSNLLWRGLEVRRRALTMSTEELADRIRALEKDLAGSKDTVAERHKRIAEEVGAVRALAKRDLTAFAEEFAASIPAQIEQQSADDVRRFLSGFIEDTWKKWLEREGALLGEKLERLAEEIVAIVQEDARETNKKLEAFLGEGTSSLDVKVDTVAYDVSVFALGAFGVGVMVLSNLLVGGLLTLAAPVLALVFKDRVDKEVKRKALQNAPDAVRNVARKIEPELLGAIDRFGEKLADFVTNANEELRRSLIEILQSTKKALAVEHSDKAVALTEVDSLLEKVRALNERVRLLRGALWEVTAAGKAPVDGGAGSSGEGGASDGGFEVPSVPAVE
ncbi:MAG: dynamin family protein [Polyangiales bacterium]